MELILKAYGADSLISIFLVVVAGWVLLFGYFVSTGIRNPLWASASSGCRASLVWWWFFASAAISSSVSWIGFVAWRLSSGLIPLPFAPNEPIGIVFGYGVAGAAILLLLGGLPRLLFVRSNHVAEPVTAPPAAPLEETPYQPLYPELSFETYQPHYGPGTLSAHEQPSPAGPIPRDVPVTERGTKSSRRRAPVLAATAAALAGAIIGIFGAFVLSSSGPGSERLALPDFARDVAGFFSLGPASGGFATDDEVPGLPLVEGGASDGDFERWRVLAEQGNAEAQYRLGVMLANGNGAARDHVEAYKWLNLAAAQGDARAARGRDALAGKMTPAEVAVSQDKARELSSFAAAKRFGEVPSRLTEMSRRELVREAQRLLNARGYQVGPADGVAGPRTRAAVREFQQLIGMPLTGDTTPELVWRLETGGTQSHSTNLRGN